MGARARRDRRSRTILFTVLVIAGGGIAAQRLPAPYGAGGYGVDREKLGYAKERETIGTTAEASDDAGRSGETGEVPIDEPDALKRRFRNAVEQLRAKRYAEAEQALQRVLERVPHLPEAHVNLGFARLGLGQVERAARSFALAVELRPGQLNAYFGLADALEQTGDLQGALGAMRTYVHLTSPDDPHLPRARAALWEWSARLAEADPG